MKKKLTTLQQITLREYSDGSGELLHARLDQGTRRMIYHVLDRWTELQGDPLRPDELLLVGATMHASEQLELLPVPPW